MKAKRAARGIYSVVDPVSPWGLPSSYTGYPKYLYTISPVEWKDLLAKAGRGDAEAEYLVAAYHSNGCKDRRGRILVKVSDQKAAEWYRRSAEHGNLYGKSALGVILGGHCGVRKNVREAMLWLRRAVRGGIQLPRPITSQSRTVRTGIFGKLSAGSARLQPQGRTAP